MGARSRIGGEPRTWRPFHGRADGGVAMPGAPVRGTPETADGSGGAQSAPELPLDTRVRTADDFATLTEALARNGFQAPTNYYLNHEVNARYASAALNNGTPPARVAAGG